MITQARNLPLPKPPKKPAPVNPEVLDRVPPQDLDAERQVLGSMILNPKCIDQVASVLTPEDFYLEANKSVASHLFVMSADEQRIDVTLLADRLRRFGQLDGNPPKGIGGAAYLAELIGSVGVVSHVKHYAEIVLRHAKRRAIINTCTSLLKSVWDSDADPEQNLVQAESLLGKVKTGSVGRDPVSMREVMVELVNRIDTIIAKKGTLGIPTGLVVFDREIGGVFAGELTVLAARTSQGKTSMALQWAAKMAEIGRNVYFASLEVDKGELGLKRVCSIAGVSSKKVRTGAMSQADRDAIVDALEVAALPNFHVQDWPELRPTDIQRAARRFKADVVFVDYLQYLKAPDLFKKRHEQVGDVSKGLKLVARQMGIPVIACAQIGRQAEQRKDTRPRLADLRESGSIEQDADCVCLLWRPEGGVSGKKGTRYEGQRWDAELDVAKNRNGPTTRIQLDWCGPRTVFSCHGEDEQEANGEAF
jgi:replicative DNA helicase